MNLTALTKRIEALEEQRKPAQRKPWVSVRRIIEDGKVTSERTWKDGREIFGYTGPVDVVINRIIVDPMPEPVGRA